MTHSPSNFDPVQEALNTVIDAIKPLTPEERKSVIRSASILFDVSSHPLLETQPVVEHSDMATSVEKFVFVKRTNKDIERVAVLGYYLSKYRKKEFFKTADLEALNLEAGGRPFINIQKAVNNATLRNTFFLMTGDGHKKMSQLGNAIVEALPDEEEVKRLVEEYKPPKRRKSIKKEM